jgi:glycine dehydrogenase subunit 1
MICELSGMDIANASLYDGASAISEACSMALSVTRNKTIVYSSLLNSSYIEVMKTYFSGRDVKLINLPAKNGITDLSPIKTYDNDIAAVIVQSPNKFGLIESWCDAKNIISNSKGLLVSVSDPVSLSLLKSPGECGADIFVGEGQSIGNHMNYGGPMIGLMAIKEKYKRLMPGRIIGKTVDNKNNVGFVLTLQTREQHIRRANATSNICTNQGLLALRSAIHLSLLGKDGLPYVAKLCYQKAQYAANGISTLSKYALLYSNKFLKEFIIKTELSAEKVICHCESKGILIAGVDMDDTNSLLQIAVTEKRTKKEIDLLISTLKEIG